MRNLPLMEGGHMSRRNVQARWTQKGDPKGGETVETVRDFILGAPKSLWMVTAAMNLKDSPWKKSCDQPRQHIQKQRHYFANKGPSSQGYRFSSSHV